MNYINVHNKKTKSKKLFFLEKMGDSPWSGESPNNRGEFNSNRSLFSSWEKQPSSGKTPVLLSSVNEHTQAKILLCLPGSISQSARCTILCLLCCPSA